MGVWGCKILLWFQAEELFLFYKTHVNEKNVSLILHWLRTAEMAEQQQQQYLGALKLRKSW